MALDGIIQTTEKDEFIYHEMLTHVPLFAHPNPKSVLIIGGGDGGILREVLKHKQLEQIVQVEIDGTVIDFCKEYLPNHSAGAYDNRRAEIVIDDGINFVCSTERRFDVVISDCTDPIGPGEVLFSSKFYEGVKRCLNPGGIFVAQNGVAFMQPSEITTSVQRLSPYFGDVSFYTAAVPTYVGGAMTFAWASDDAAQRTVDAATLAERLKASGMRMRYYNAAIHRASFALPQYLIDAIDNVEGCPTSAAADQA
jgi:spermidine synthase